MLPRDGVVVGVDGSFAAIRAARWAAAIAENFAAPLHLLYANHSDSAEAILQSAERAVRTHFKALHITRTHVDRPVLDALVQVSRGALLVVLGTDEPASPRGTPLAGPTTLAVVAHSVCPVVVWRGDAVALTPQPILVGVDHDSDSQVAITAAFEFANRLGLSIIAVHAWAAEATPSAIALRRFENDARKHLTDVLAPWVDLYPNVGVTEVVHHDDPGNALLRYTQGAQLVAVGRGSLRDDALSGSAGLTLLQHSAVPVMICRSVDSGDHLGPM